MRLSRAFVCTLLFATTSVIATAQTRQQKEKLVDDLNRSYSFTTGKTVGSLYTIHISGLSERPTVDGTEPIFTLTSPNSPTEKTSIFTDTHGTRDVQPGDQFFLSTIDVNEHYLIFHLESLDRHTVVTHGTSDRMNFVLALKFPLQPGNFATLTAARVHALVDPVLSLSSTSPATVQVGQSESDVEQILGKPDQEIDLDSKHIMVFKAIKVIFVNGKVTDIQ